MEQAFNVDTVIDRIGEIEKSIKQLESRLRINREAMQLQDETITILLPLSVEIATDAGVPREVKRRIAFALRQVEGIAKRMAALNS